MDTLQKFKSGIYHVLVATDVAARGLDIKSIKSVVNFDIARDMDMHVHRIGRTGRAGDKDGTAYTLITQKEARFAGELVNSLITAGQNVSVELMDLATKDGRFKAKRDARKVLVARKVEVEVGEVCAVLILGWELVISPSHQVDHLSPSQIDPLLLIH